MLEVCTRAALRYIGKYALVVWIFEEAAVMQVRGKSMDIEKNNYFIFLFLSALVHSVSVHDLAVTPLTAGRTTK